MIEGDTRMGSLMAGQVAAMVNKVQPAREIIREVVTEAEEVLAQRPKQVMV